MDMFAPDKLAAMLVVLISTVINLLIMYLVLKRFLFKPIMKMMNKRQQEAADMLKNAETAQQKALQDQENAKKQIDHAVQEAARIVHEAQNHANANSQAILDDAKQKAKDTLTRADTECDHMKLSLLNDVRGEIADLALSIASQAISAQMDKTVQKQMIDEILTEKLGPAEPAAPAAPDSQSSAGEATSRG